MDAVVLAGGRTVGELREFTGAESKALIPIKGKPMLEYVINALNEAKLIERIVVVGPWELLDLAIAKRVGRIVEEGKDFIENIEIGLNALGCQANVLLVAGDVPLITGESVDAFIEKAQKDNPQISIPSIDIELCKARYPGVKRTYAKFAEGSFKNGNLAIIAPQLFYSNKEMVERVFESRKSVLKLGQLLGWGFVLRLILGTLFGIGKISIKELEERASAVLGGHATTPVVPYPELGFDVDGIDDLKAIQKYI